MDWNWFFSALAQSTAAIVGLIGAFVFTKIVNNQAEFDRFQRELESLISRSDYLKDRSAHRYSDWYNGRVRHQAAEKVEAALRSDDPPAGDEELIADSVISPFDDKEEAYRSIREVAQRVRRELAEEERKRAQRRPFTGLDISYPADLVINPAAYQVRSLREYQIDDQVRAEREQIDALVIEIRHHLSEISRAIRTAELSPFSSGAVSKAMVLLAALFVVGVIYPLSFMPVEPGRTITISELTVFAFFPLLFSLKGFLLLAVAAGVLGLAFGFRSINASLVTDRRTTEALQSRAQMTWYSEYLRELEEEGGP